jgi:hypothetical protein
MPKKKAGKKKNKRRSGRAIILGSCRFFFFQFSLYFYGFTFPMK